MARLLISIAFENNLSSLAVFDGKCYVVYPSIWDNFIKTKTLKLISEFNPDRLIMSLKTPKNTIKIFNLYKIIKEDINSAKIKRDSQISKAGWNSILLLKTHLNHISFSKNFENNIIGIIDGYKVYSKQDPCAACVDIEDLKVLGLLDKQKFLLKEATTTFGKEILNSWIKSPFNSANEILERQNIQAKLCCYLPRIEKSLKKFKIPKIDKTINFQRLKIALKTGLILSNLLKDIISLQKYTEYKKLYKILRIFNKNEVKEGIDADLDAIVNIYKELPSILNEIASIISKERNIRCTVVYLPEIGFLVESDKTAEDVLFKISGKYYFKTHHLRTMDEKIGSIYEEFLERKLLIISKIEQKIRKVDFNWFYNFIGELDAYTAMIKFASTCNSNFPVFLKENEICENPQYEISIDQYANYGSIRLDKNSIIRNDGEIPRILVRLIISAQIGLKVDCNRCELKVYNRIMIKFGIYEISGQGESQFMRELNIIDNFLKNQVENSLYIIEDIGQFTNPIFGYALFKTVLDSLKKYSFFAATIYDISEDQIDFNIYISKEVNGQKCLERAKCHISEELVSQESFSVRLKEEILKIKID